ncbi:hypothetical protein ACJ41O_006428 [Fusarium nematophilum]
MMRTLLITGATGKQGGAVIRSLLAEKANFRILAVTRDPTSASAKRLADQSNNIKLVQGDLNDVEAIFGRARKIEPSIWGVYSVQLPAMNKNGLVIEERQGKALVDAALQHGVEHFVYSSVDRGGERSIDNPTDIPHFISKHNIEHHLISKAQGSNMSWTILRPVAFMENFDGGFVGKVFATAWRIVVKSQPLQLIAADDIGVFGAKAFLDPATYADRAISLAGDELGYQQMANIFEGVTRAPVPVTWALVARLFLWLSKEPGTMFAFFEREGHGANTQELKKMHPGLMDLKTWLGQKYPN